MFQVWRCFHSITWSSGVTCTFVIFKRSLHSEFIPRCLWAIWNCRYKVFLFRNFLLNNFLSMLSVPLLLLLWCFTRYFSSVFADYLVLPHVFQSHLACQSQRTNSPSALFSPSSNPLAHTFAVFNLSDCSSMQLAYKSLLKVKELKVFLAEIFCRLCELFFPFFSSRFCACRETISHFAIN